MGYRLGFAEPTRHRQRFPHEALFTLPVRFVRIMEHEREAERSDDASRVVGSFALSERALQPVDGLGIAGPEPPGELHDKQLERRLAVPVRPGPFESSPVVRQIGENPTPRGEPFGLRKPGGLAQEEVAVTAAAGVIFLRQSQPLIGVVAKRLQQAVPNVFAGAFSHD